LAKPSLSAIKDLFAASWEASASERSRFSLFIVLFILSNLIELSVPWAIGYTLSVYVAQGITEEAFYESLKGIGAYVLLRLLHTLFHHVARHQQNQVSYRAKMASIQKIFGSLMTFPLNWHVKHHSGENLSKLFRSAGAVENTIGTYIWQIVEGLIKVFFAGFAIFALDFWVAVNVLVVSTISILGMVFFNRRLTDAYRANNYFANKVNRVCVDYLSHIVTVKTLRFEDAAKKYLGAQESEGLGHCRRISRFSELKWSMTGIGYGMVIGSSMLIYFYTNKGLNEPFEITKVYVLLNYLDRIFQAIGSFTGYYSGIIEASIAYEDAKEIIQKAAAIPPPLVVSNLSRDWQTLNFEKLTYSYQEGEKVGLKEASFYIEKGKSIALVGPSGGGKSTLLKLLAGVYYPNSSHITTDLNDSVSIEEVAHTALLVPQEPEVFSETLRYNLTMGDARCDAELIEIVELCKLHRVLESLPQRFEADLAENGQNLSVGEKQRVALARGLLRIEACQLLLLDEPTSSLDPKTEREIFESLFSRYRGRTILSACHRLSLMPLFDQIIFVSGGRVLEQGSFSGLISKGGAFAKSWQEYENAVKNIE
jgi:ABC-type multidrug transport system fused ATPase/permease subunit